PPNRLRAGRAGARMTRRIPTSLFGWHRHSRPCGFVGWGGPRQAEGLSRESHASLVTTATDARGPHSTTAARLSRSDPPYKTDLYKTGLFGGPSAAAFGKVLSLSNFLLAIVAVALIAGPAAAQKEAPPLPGDGTEVL